MKVNLTNYNHAVHKVKAQGLMHYALFILLLLYFMLFVFLLFYGL